MGADLAGKEIPQFFGAAAQDERGRGVAGVYALRSAHNIDEMRVALLPHLEKADRVLIASVSGEVAICNALCGNDALQRLFAAEE